MTITYRLAEYDDFDIGAVVGIALAVRPNAFESVAQLVEWHRSERTAGRLCMRWLVSADGRVVGSAYVGQSPRRPPEVTSLYVAVHPDHQNRGYGRALLDRAEVTASERGGDAIYSWTDQTQPRSIRFLEHAGYHEIDRGWVSTLDLTQCDPKLLWEAVDRVVASGIRITSVAAFAKEQDDWKQELHQLHTNIEMDVPTPYPIPRIPFDDFEVLNLGSRFVDDGFFIALDGNRVVGLTEPQSVDGSTDIIAQNLTGVHPNYRGRSIATALKSRAAIWAIENSYTSIRTHNAQSNASMLAINNRLGFLPNHATFEYLKNL